MVHSSTWQQACHLRRPMIECKSLYINGLDISIGPVLIDHGPGRT
jgi:hypothetical protein